MTFGACAKHPNFPMINCPMCESEKPLTMYNREALRKELEDCWDAAGSRCTAVLSVGSDNAKPPDKYTYITNRIAALDDGDDGVSGKDFAKWIKENCEVIREPGITLYRYNDYRHGEGFGNYILDDIYTTYKELVGVDDGQEGRGQVDLFLQLRQALKPFAKIFPELTESKVRQGGPVFEYNGIQITVADFFYAFNVLTNPVPVADGEGEKVWWFYCQSYFEEKGICKDQCDHCKEYYKPLEMVNRSNVKWVKAREVIGSFDEDKLLTFKSGGMNYTGWYHSDKNIFEDVLAGFFPIDSVYVLIEQQPLLPSSVTSGVKDAEKISDDGKTGIVPVMSTERLYQLFKSGYKSEGQPAQE